MLDLPPYTHWSRGPAKTYSGFFRLVSFGDEDNRQETPSSPRTFQIGEFERKCSFATHISIMALKLRSLADWRSLGSLAVNCRPALHRIIKTRFQSHQPSQHNHLLLESRAKTAVDKMNAKD
jgi:hypothetical protein